MVLALDDSETVLRCGDVVVQRGTSHRWENRSGQISRIVFVLVDAAFTEDRIGTLGEDATRSLLKEITEDGQPPGSRLPAVTGRGGDGHAARHPQAT